MVTPTKRQILEKALELYAKDQYRNGCGDLAEITPEISELAESGYLQSAKSELMTDMHKIAIENEYVNFPEQFNIDLNEFYKTNALILGSRSQGKSDLAMIIAEKCMQDKAIVISVDPSLDWRERSTIPNILTVEPHKTLAVPTESVIFDVSLCSPLEMQKIVERFSKNLFNYQANIDKNLRRQYVVVLEESHLYYYQGVMRSKNSANSVKLISVGRNVDCCCLLISQFASMIDKFCVKHALSQAWFGFTREYNDIEYLKQILGLDVKHLKKLNQGEFLFMNKSEIQKIAIEPFESNVTKREIIAESTPTPQPIKPIPKTTQSTQANYALIKAGVILLIGLLILLLGVC